MSSTVTAARFAPGSGVPRFVQSVACGRWCGLALDHVRTHDVRAVGNVNAINVSGPLEVTVRVGPAASLEVEADSNLLPMIRTEVRAGVLRMWVEGRVRSANRLRVNYTVPSLAEARASGSSHLMIRELNSAPFSFNKTGSAWLRQRRPQCAGQRAGRPGHQRFGRHHGNPGQRNVGGKHVAVLN